VVNFLKLARFWNLTLETGGNKLQSSVNEVTQIGIQFGIALVHELIPAENAIAAFRSVG
jgi:hypothetical protein